MLSVLDRARRKLQRDLAQGASPVELVSKSMSYLVGLASAPVLLRHVDEVGPGVRTVGRPRIDNQGRMSIGANTVLRSVNVPVELATGREGHLEIGPDCSLNYGVSIGCLASVRIGARCRLGPYVMIVDSDFHDVYDRSRRPPPKPVVLEDDVWVGAKASLMPGVHVGRGAVVGTAAVVTHDVEPFTVVGGVPAKVLHRLDPEKFVAPR